MSEPRPKPRRPDAETTVTWPMRVAAAWSWRVLVVAAALWLLSRVFIRLELVIFSFIVALFFTAVLHPVELWLRRIPGPRSLSAALALLIGIAVIGGIGYFVGWQISTHSSELADQINNFVDKTRNWLQRGPLHLKSSDLDKIATNISNAVKSHQALLISGAIQTVRTVVEFLGGLLLVLLSTFFLLRDGDTIWGWAVRLFPRAAHERVDMAGRVGWGAFGGYMRGQVLIALFHGVSVMIVLFVLRVPLAAPLGVLIFLGSFVPLVGITAAGAFCAAVALLEHGVTAAIVVVVAITVLVQLEAHFLQPVIMSRSVDLHPLAIAFAVLSGTLLAGIVGALLAVPLVAFLNSTILALRRGPEAVPAGAAEAAANESPTEQPNSEPVEKHGTDESADV